METGPSPKPTAPVTRGVIAGTLLLASMLGVAGILAAIGSLFGATVGLGIAGLFAGLVLGLFLVIRRFRDL